MSSGGDGGHDTFGSITKSLSLDSFSGKGNFFENLLSDALNITTQRGTFGLVGFDTKHGLKAGVAVDALKEVTGATAAEEANQQARQQFEEQKAAAEKDRQMQIQTKGVQQIQASQLAGAARRAGTTSNSQGLVGQGLTLGSDGKDFLGL